MSSAVRTVFALLALSGCARPTEEELEARQDAKVERPDAAEADVASETRRDASTPATGLDAKVDSAKPPSVAEDARVDASGVVSPPVTDANVAPPAQDAGGPLTCDISPCQGHCVLATVCCSPIQTCGCQFGPDQPCVLPPIGAN